MTVERFKIAVPQRALNDLKSRLSATRFAQEHENADWRYGMNTAYLRELVDY